MQQHPPITMTSALLISAVIIANLAAVGYALPPPLLRGACNAVADAEEIVGNKALAVGKQATELVMKPIAIAGGLKAAAVGTGMKLSGAAVKFVGAKLVKDGLLIETAGAGVKGAGLGVAALGVKPLAEKVVAAGQIAQKSIDGAQLAAEKIAKTVGDTRIELDAKLESPFVGEHHKHVNVTSGFNTILAQTKKMNQIEETIEQQPAEQMVEQNIREKRAPKVDPEVAKATFNLIREAKLEDCVARAICDLNCSPQGFGHDGKQVFMNMVRLQGASGFDNSETKYFHEAASKGRSYSGKCDQCSTLYSKCKSKSTDLIKMASHIRLD